MNEKIGICLSKSGFLRFHREGPDPSCLLLSSAGQLCREILQTQYLVHSWTKVIKFMHFGVIQALKSTASNFSTKRP